VTPSPVPVGRLAAIDLEPLDEAYSPMPGASLSCLVSWIGEDGVEASDRFEAKLDGNGRYRREWLPKDKGPHRLTVTGEGGISTEERFLVEDDDKEQGRLYPDEPLLRKIAEATAGRFERNALHPETMATKREAAVEVLSRTDTPIWDHPAAIVLFILLLASEWALRRRHGLW